MPRKKQYNEEQVLEKAMRIFWKNGYEATSIRTLEKGMGINQFSIYARFHSKRNLLVESLRFYQTKIDESLLSKIDQTQGGLSEIKSFFFDFVRFVTIENKADGCLNTNTMLELRARDKKVQLVINRFLEKVSLIFKTLVENSKKRGEMSRTVDTQVIVHYLLGALQGLAASIKVLDRKQVKDYIETAFINLT